MLDGKMYTLNPSSWDKNHIHGGTVGFDKKLWVGNIITNGVELFYSSPGNDEQFLTVTMMLVTSLSIIVSYIRHQHRCNHFQQQRTLI